MQRAAPDPGPDRRSHILDAAILVFGRLGFRKTSMDDLAEAAQISKQGLYLYFPGKQDLFEQAIKKYLDDGLALVDAELTRADAPLLDRLAGAMDAWFGRHFSTFTPGSADVIEAGRQPGSASERYKEAFKARIAKALTESAELKKAKNVCSPREIALVLFTCGLSWKEGHASRADFVKQMRVCIRAACQLER